ncbi:dynein light chain 1, cytoplasmic-like [Cimex lectularius]|uniref:Dynein light chain n=1 Tax=Cimex lectularius TaxID=79782 RepID=A0A8I6SCL9_CIMLE|nr:dynein light chain 1, cytoplasmic-like [Cimex lectularius]
MTTGTEFRWSAVDAKEQPPDLPPFETKHYIKRQPVVKYTDMPDKMKKEVLAISHKAMAKYYNEVDIAVYIKEQLDQKFRGGLWQVIVGRDMNVSCNYETGKYIYFYLGHLGFIVYRSGAL